MKINKDALKKLGEGNFGAVYLYTDAAGNERVIKFVQIPENVKKEKAEII